MKQGYFLHRPNLTINADFSSESPPVFRYRLEITKDDASDTPKTVCAIMQNPSYANEEIADKTVHVLEKFVFEKNIAEFKSIERLIVVNQFAFIQTKDFEGTFEQIGNRNDEAISNAIDESDIVLIAWGKENGFTKRQNHILEIVKSKKDKKLLITSRHPSRALIMTSSKDIAPNRALHLKSFKTMASYIEPSIQQGEKNLEPLDTFINEEDGTTVLKCPHCRYARTVSVIKFIGKQKAINVKCSCMKSYSVKLVHRKTYRKNTNLKGRYTNLSLNNEAGILIVKDVSMGGIGFEVVGGNRIEKEHDLMVTFTLDDTYSSVITKQVVARHVRDKFVGTEFLHAHEYDKALGFYLSP